MVSYQDVIAPKAPKINAKTLEILTLSKPNKYRAYNNRSVVNNDA